MILYYTYKSRKLFFKCSKKGISKIEKKKYYGLRFYNQIIQKVI